MHNIEYRMEAVGYWLWLLAGGRVIFNRKGGETQRGI
jgi:hypothetical protein